MLIQRLKRGLAWLLATFLVLAAIAGCTSQSASSRSQPQAAAQSQETSPQNQTPAAAQSQEVLSQSQPQKDAQGQETPSRSQPQAAAQSQETSSQSQPQAAAQSQEASSQNQPPAAAQGQEASSQSRTLTEFQAEEIPAAPEKESADEKQEPGASPDIQEEDPDVSAIEEDGSYTTRDEVALYLHTYGRLPDNYITKKDAENLGWDSKKGNLWDVAPGKSIGGSYFGNYEKQLPEKKGRKYYECDINYEGKYRGAERIIYSDDGLVFYTGDHYETFEQLYP